MSSTVNFDMTLMAASCIVPEQTMRRVFLSCVEEMHGEVKSNALYIDGERLGQLTLGKRIILQHGSYMPASGKKDELRKLFTKRIAVAQTDYLNELEESQRRLRESAAAEASLLAEIKEMERAKAKSVSAMQRQEKPECEAIKEELCEAAEAKGYDVVEEKTEQGIQLQFVRREY